MRNLIRWQEAKHRKIMCQQSFEVHDPLMLRVVVLLSLCLLVLCFFVSVFLCVVASVLRRCVVCVFCCSYVCLCLFGVCLCVCLLVSFFALWLLCAIVFDVCFCVYVFMCSCVSVFQ